MAFSDRGTYRLHFETRGPADARDLLLVMGMGFSSRAWAGLPDRLAERFRVITFDNRGTGRSTRGPGSFRIRDLAADAAAVLDAAGASNALVFGISMGGMVALELALRHPEKVNALVLGCTFAGWLGSRKPSPGALRDLLVANVSFRGMKARSLARLLVSPDYYRSRPDEFAAWLKTVEYGGPWLGALQSRAIALHHTDPRLSEIRVPTLVLTGDQDQLVPPENSRRLVRRIPGAELVEITGAGHCFPLERPADTLKVLVDFFDSTGTQRRAGSESSSGLAAPFWARGLSQAVALPQRVR